MLKGLRAYLDEITDSQSGAYRGPRPTVDSKQFFYDDTIAWKAFRWILNPTNPVEYEDACNSARPGLCIVNT